MGVAGRDYMRREGNAPGWFPGRTTWSIIAVNAALWVVFAMAASSGPSGPWRPPVPTGGLGGFLWQQCVLHPDEVFGQGKVWQLFTAFWLHDWSGASHVLFNMVALYFFGRIAEGVLGGRRFLWLYLAGGLASTTVLTLYGSAIGDVTPALGASGAVFAVLVWVACLLPRQTVYLMFILPLPMWLAVGVLMVGLELLALGGRGSEVGAAVGHLSGAALGFLHYQLWRRGRALGGPGGWMVRLRRTRAPLREAHARRSFDGDPAEEAAVRARVDALLARISAEGMASLTEEEKDFLQEAARRFR